jgi:hypothetical protein
MAPDDTTKAVEAGMSLGQWLGRVETKVDNLDTKIDGRFERVESRVDSLESWRDQLRGAASIVKIAFGTSIISAVLSVLTLIALVAGSVRA